MKIIGLCGGSGAGKGEVCRLFMKYGIPSVDTDAVSRIVMKKGSECYGEVVAAFGDGILGSDGEIVRKTLAEAVFADPQKRKTLEKITHKHIIAYSDGLFAGFAEEGYAAAIADAPLLFESGMDRICFRTVAVISDAEKRVERITARDGITRELALKRINAQIPSEELIKRCDYAIFNDGTLEQLDIEVKRTADEIKKEIEKEIKEETDT